MSLLRKQSSLREKRNQELIFEDVDEIKEEEK